MAINLNGTTLDSREKKAHHILNLQNLLKESANQSELLEVPLANDFDFTQNEYAYIIESGSVLVTGEKNTHTGLLSAYLLGVNDPIGFAEAIVARPSGLRFKQKTDLKLRKFNSLALRQFVARANIFSKTIIKYSISRILGQSRGSASFAFEEEFIDDNYELLNRRVAAQNDVIVTIGETAERMFFIDSGSVRIISGQNKLIANLGAGSCFGESALFNAGLCTHKVIANSKTNLLAIHREQVEIEINQEPPIVRLIALLLIKRLEVMNTLRERDQSSLG